MFVNGILLLSIHFFSDKLCMSFSNENFLSI